MSGWHQHHTYAASNTAKTRKDVGAECRHDMRPSVQLPSISGVDSKLGLTMVRPSLQSAPELLALDPPPVSNHVRQIWGNFLRCLTYSDFDLWPFKQKLAMHLLMPGRMFTPILIFWFFFCFRVMSPYGTDRRMDRQTYKKQNAAYRMAT